ncbi:MAG TPA: nicotinamide-nucleotide amidohydrolase family protein [Opitutaceae bacterium]|jgi:nicotinamide-nucleotide amidase
MADLKELMLRAPRLTLAVAESLTCGRLQARIGATSGASEYFLGGITAYTIEQKARHLGIDPGEARAVNAVSARVAEQMARGACALFGSDIGAATTGYAEPAPQLGVEFPFAWWGLARRLADGQFAAASGRVECRGLSRVQAQEKVAGAAFDALVAWVREPAAARTT